MLPHPQTKLEAQRRNLANVAQNRVQRQEALSKARWVVNKPNAEDAGPNSARPNSAYAGARSRAQITSDRNARRPGSAGSVLSSFGDRPSSGPGQVGRRTTEQGNFIATGLLNLKNLQIKRSKTAPEWMRKRLARAHALPSIA